MSVTPDEVKRFKKPTPGFLCKINDDKYKIDFLEFTIVDYDTKRKIFHVDKDSPPPTVTPAKYLDDPRDMQRSIDYKFESEVLSLPRVTTKLKFHVGRREVRNFRMIERHYFKNKLIKSFDFNFPYCIPDSTNTWYSEYELPPMDSALIDQIVKRPFEVVSDSFYFVNNKLIKHNKARYHYYYTAETLRRMEAKSGSSSEASKTPDEGKDSSKSDFDDGKEDFDDDDDEGKFSGK